MNMPCGNTQAEIDHDLSSTQHDRNTEDYKFYKESFYREEYLESQDE